MMIFCTVSWLTMLQMNNTRYPVIVIILYHENGKLFPF